MNDTPEINIQLLSINELLRSPVSLYRKRILKNDAEDFIIEEAEAFPRRGAINMKIHLAASEGNYENDIAPAIHKHFTYRREQSQKEYKRIFHYGWRILCIGLGLLVVIFSLTEITLHLMPDNKLILFVRESFIIFGWVALWRPIELLLYDWYPIKQKINLYGRLEKSTIRVIINKSGI